MIWYCTVWERNYNMVGMRLLYCLGMKSRHGLEMKLLYCLGMQQQHDLGMRLLL